MHIWTKTITVLSLLVLGRTTKLNFQGVLNWLKKLITSQDWTQALCLCVTMS